MSGLWRNARARSASGRSSRADATTVRDDGAIDDLSGNQDQDWFFALVGGSSADLVRSRLDSEVLTALL